jgi:hypothetical protein
MEAPYGRRQSYNTLRDDYQKAGDRTTQLRHDTRRTNNTNYVETHAHPTIQPVDEWRVAYIADNRHATPEEKPSGNFNIYRNHVNVKVHRHRAQ